MREILTQTGQDCSGDCTPARRYFKSQKFVWDMECALKATYKSQCKDIVTIFCFADVKVLQIVLGTFSKKFDQLCIKNINYFGTVRSTIKYR